MLADYESLLNKNYQFCTPKACNQLKKRLKILITNLNAWGLILSYITLSLSS